MSNMLTPHFSLDSPDMLGTCRHCDKVTPYLNSVLRLAKQLEVTRSRVGVALTVISGYRCYESEAIQDALAQQQGRPHTKGGYHPLSMAADVRYQIDGMVEEEMAALKEEGWKGIEVKEGSDGEFISVHLDTRDGAPWIVDTRN